jgi:hypothetical protein
MPRVNYTSESPYYTTPQTSFFLLHLNFRKIPFSSSDVFYTLESKYQYRPDLLAFDVYGDPRYWWIFQNMNMDTIKDPIWDFKPGITIRYATRDRLNEIIR